LKLGVITLQKARWRELVERPGLEGAFTKG
jgi:hypothetical protein